MFKRSDERKLSRLQGYDYSQSGYYFVTICILDMPHLFGQVKNGCMNLNKRGKIAEQCWYDLPNHYDNCFLDEMVIMPNHVHGIIVIDNDSVVTTVGNGFKPLPSFKNKPNPGNNKSFQNICQKPPAKQHGLSEMMRAFKTFTARKINIKYPNIEFKWQKSFNDRIIRNEKELFAIREYIKNNPRNYNL